MIEKHSQEQLEIRRLKETIELRNKEIRDIKFSVADVLLDIMNINESNEYSDPSVRRRISELCRDTRYELLIDEILENREKEGKIIELPNRKIR